MRLGGVTAIKRATHTRAGAQNKRDERVRGLARCVGKGGQARRVVARFSGVWRVCGVVAVGAWRARSGTLGGMGADGARVCAEALTVDGWRIGGRARTSGGGGARGFPSVRGARGCTRPYKMRGGEMAVLPHLSERRKIVDKLRGMWYNGGGRQLSPTVGRRERKGEAWRMKVERRAAVYCKCSVCGRTTKVRVVKVAKGDGSWRPIYICKECEE